MRGEKIVVGITGVPCTGKTTFSKRTASRCDAVDVIEINDVVEKYHTFSRKDEAGARIVNLGALTRRLRMEIGARRGRLVLVVGHLAQEVGVGYDLAIVLRLGLKDLGRRMENRGYPVGKIRENLVAEALDYCGVNMAARCKIVFEVETARERDRASRYLIALARGVPARAPRRRAINKMEDIIKLVENGNKYGL